MGKRRLVVLFSLLFLLVSASPLLAKEKVNMEFKQAPLVDVFQILGELGGYNVLVDQSVSGDVTFTLKGLTVEEALDLVTRTTGYRYKLVGNTLVIGSGQRLKTEFGEEDFSFIKIQYVDAADAQRLVALVAPSLKSYIDREQNLLVLFGLSSDLKLAQDVLRQYDRNSAQVSEPTSADPDLKNESLIQDSVQVLYGDGTELVTSVKQRWPERNFSWQAESGLLIGEATEAEWLEIAVFVLARDLPDFSLKGILSSPSETIALVEYRGVTSSLKQGDVLNDWQLSKIGEGLVEFRLGQKSLVLRMGR